MIIERGYLDHWKTTALRAQTGCEAASEFPIRLWEHCESRLRGEMHFLTLHKDATIPVPLDLQADRIADPDGSGNIIAGICRWRASQANSQNPVSLCDALVACRWLKKVRGGWLVLGWRERMAGKVASATNGRSGGRPRKNPQDTKDEPNPNPEKPTGYEKEPVGGECSVVECSVVKLSPPPSPAGGPAYARMRGADDKASDPETLHSAKKRMCGMLRLDPARPWSPDAEQGLQAIVPIPEEEWLAVEWLHAQPADDKRRPKLRTSPTSLTREWIGEVSKARALANELGISLGQKKEAAPPADPPGWADWLSAKGYPSLPYPEADGTLRRAFREQPEPQPA